MNAQYRHSQPGYLMIVVGMVLAATGAIMCAFGLKPLGIIFVVAGAFIFVFGYKLTVEIENGFLRLWFGPGVFWKTISLEQISYCEPYRGVICGWGIRWCPDGWLYNVSGLKAVTIVFKSGKKIYIGTDEPQQLIEAISLAIHGRVPDKADLMWIEAKADYLKRVEQALSANRHPRSFEIIAEVGEHLDRRFGELESSQRMWENFQKIITEMGPPSEYAELVSGDKKSSVLRFSGLEITAVGLLLVMLGISAYFYPRMPQIMATQWDFYGRVSSTMPKTMGLFPAPVLLATFVIALIIIPRAASVSVNLEGFKKVFGGIVITVSIITSAAQCHVILWNLGIKSSPNWVVALAAVSIAVLLLWYYRSRRQKN
jgi:hypothetical protein